MCKACLRRLLWERSYRGTAGLSTLPRAGFAHHESRNFPKEHLMKYAYLMRTAIVAATLGAGCVLAQTDAPVVNDFARTAPAVVSDVGPPPAEERDSAGAIVLQDSMVRAQRDQAFHRAASRNGLASVGQRVMRARMEVQPQGELAQARAPEPIELYQPDTARQIPN
jgi:hypothetical protein